MTTRTVVRVRRLYGAHPLHLLLVLGSFAVVGYVLWRLGFAALWNPDSWWQSIAVWFVGAALAHDLVLFPAYAAADRIVVALTSRRTARRRARVPMVNFVRVPLLAVGVLTLLFFPGVIEQGADSYYRATGQNQEPFLLRWLLLCAIVLGIGLICYLVARTRSARSPDPEIRSARDDLPDVATTASTTASAWTLVVLAVLVGLAARRRRSARHPG